MRTVSKDTRRHTIKDNVANNIASRYSTYCIAQSSQGYREGRRGVKRIVNGMALGQILTQSLTRNEHPATQPRRVASQPALSQGAVALSKNLNRLLTAAVINPRFRGLLLADPATALKAGYNGEIFALTPAEYAAVISLRATTMRDWAAQLLTALHYHNAEAIPYAPETKNEMRFA
jgi:hypothetical protein